MDDMDVDNPPLYLRLLVRAPVYTLVFSSLSPRSLVRIALTCRDAYLAVVDFKRRAFNINRHLSRFFSQPLAFRSLQAKTNTLISGSNALQFLDRTFYPESDLDIYTHPGHTFEVAQFLAEEEGYQFSPRDEQEQDWKEVVPSHWDGTEPRLIMGETRLYHLQGITGVWTFQKTGVDRQSLRIQIIGAASSPLEAILQFHSTCVMNVISSDAAYALYPFATFEERSALCMRSGHDTPRPVEKYVARGWRVYFVPTPYHTAHPTERPFFLRQERWVGDKDTWVLPLDQTGVKERPPLSPGSAPLKLDPVLSNGWKLMPVRDWEPNGYECRSHPVQTTVFRYNYAIPDEDLTLAIRRWAHQQGKHSHREVSKEDWVWFDADLPSFIRKE